MPKVVHVKDKVPGAVFIGRPGPYGNPFVIGRHGTRQEVIELYRKLLIGNKPLWRRAIQELKGKDLACFCAPLPCHGDVLLSAVNDPKHFGS